jgi:hypothetical protein
MGILKIKFEPFKVYLIDTSSDLDDLTSAPIGSFALCIDSSVIYVKDIEQNEWTETTLTSLPM